MKRIVICGHCGGEFVGYDKWLRRNGKSGHSYCSKTCWDNFRKESRVDSKCVICGKTFEVTPSRVPRIVTCSDECRRERLSRERIKALERVRLNLMVKRVRAAQCNNSDPVIQAQLLEADHG